MMKTCTRLMRTGLLAAAMGLLGVSAQAQMAVSSPAFADNATLPNPFTNSLGGQCSGSNWSPPLAIAGIPAGTQTLAITMIDTSVPGGFLHWKVWDIAVPAGASSVSLPYNAAASLPASTQATNGFGTTGYGGACPPPAGTPGLPDTHSYVFTVYALSTPPGGGEPTGATLAAVAAPNQARLTGTRAQASNVAWAPPAAAAGGNVASVPTMSELGLALMGLVLAGGAWLRRPGRQA